LADQMLLEVVAGNEAGRKITVPPSGAVLGRGHDCDIRLDEPTLSRKHCKFTCEKNGVWHVHDLGSKSGVILNGKNVPIYYLNQGDELELGNLRLKVISIPNIQEPSGPVSDERHSDRRSTHMVVGTALLIATVLVVLLILVTVGHLRHPRDSKLKAPLVASTAQPSSPRSVPTKVYSLNDLVNAILDEEEAILDSNAAAKRTALQQKMFEASHEPKKVLRGSKVRIQTSVDDVFLAQPGQATAELTGAGFYGKSPTYAIFFRDYPEGWWYVLLTKDKKALNLNKGSVLRVTALLDYVGLPWVQDEVDVNSGPSLVTLVRIGLSPGSHVGFTEYEGRFLREWLKRSQHGLFLRLVADDIGNM